MTGQKIISLSDADLLAEKQAQLSALLETLGGEGSARFRQMSDTIQDNLLWLAGSLAADIGDVLKRVA